MKSIIKKFKSTEVEEVSENVGIKGAENEALENEILVENEEQIPNENIETLPERKTICISKMGSDHKFANMNNQDFTFNILNMKVVLDGCGTGKHSEVGVRIFSQLFARECKAYIDRGEEINENNFRLVVDIVFSKMLALCSDISFLFQNYCFTILICFEHEDEFVVLSAGDGFIIKEDENGITFDVLDDGEYPAYYVYNFVQPKSLLKEYKEGVSFKEHHYSKEEFMNVGVASDGFRFFENLLDVEKIKFMNFLHEGKGPQLEILINRNNLKNEMFHDDISICF